MPGKDKLPTRCCVLGAGGFIGRALLARLAAAGVDVIAATRRPVHVEGARVRNVVADFDRPQHFVDLLADCDAIVHAAAVSTPASSSARPQVDGNLATTLALLEALQQHPDRRLLFLSSGGTLYGDHPGLAPEEAPMRPRSYHGAGKAAAEHFIHAWAAQFGGTATILRPSNVYGPGQQDRPGFGLVPTALRCLVEGRPLPVYGDGSHVRDYLYIDDLVDLCERVLAAAATPGAQVYNASAARGTSVTELLDLVELTCGASLLRHAQPPRAVDVHRIVPDNAAARTAFDWLARVPLEEGLRRTWHWYRANRRP